MIDCNCANLRQVHRADSAWACGIGDPPARQLHTGEGISAAGATAVRMILDD
jgi:hypothetical protein